MARSIHQPYRLADGSKAVSVTTVLSRFKEAGGLIHWAWQLGLDGIDYREARDTAAGIGTLAHDAVEAFIKGRDEQFNWLKDPDLSGEDIKRSQQSYGNFLDWAGTNGLEVRETEVPMVCEHYRYGGRPDAILVKNKLALGDWKTSNGVYVEYLLQLAAYKHLWDDYHPDEPLEGGFYLLRFSKDFGDFSERHWSELDSAWEAFKLMRPLYDLMNELKKRVA